MNQGNFVCGVLLFITCWEIASEKRKAMPSCPLGLTSGFILKVCATWGEVPTKPVHFFFKEMIICLFYFLFY